MTDQVDGAPQVQTLMDAISIGAISTLSDDQIRAILTCVDEYGRQPLHLAARVGSHTWVSRLLALGADVNALDRRKHTAAHYSMWDESAQVLALLLSQKNFDFAATDDEGFCPIHKAAGTGSEAALLALLRAGDDPNRLWLPQNYTPLHIAVDGNANCLRLLLQWGADPDAVDKERRWTPLHLACAFGNRASVLELLSFGVSLRTDSHSKTPVDVLRLHNCTHTLQDVHELIEQQCVWPPSLAKLCRRTLLLQRSRWRAFTWSAVPVDICSYVFGGGHLSSVADMCAHTHPERFIGEVEPEQHRDARQPREANRIHPTDVAMVVRHCQDASVGYYQALKALHCTQNNVMQAIEIITPGRSRRMRGLDMT